jgi:hypothetical protein
VRARISSTPGWRSRRCFATGASIWPARLPR